MLLSASKEIPFVKAQQRVEGLDRWHRGFADTDGADLLGLDQFDLDGATRNESRQHGGGRIRSPSVVRCVKAILAAG